MTLGSFAVRSSACPTRILFVHASDELYGSDIVLLQLISGLDRRQFEPIVVLPADVHYEGKLSAALDQIRVSHYSVKMGVIRRRYFHVRGMFQYLFYLANGVRQILQIIKSDGIHVVHSNTSAVLGGAIAARLCQIPHIWHVHEILTRPVWLSNVIRRFIVANSDCVVCISEAVADYIDPNWNMTRSQRKGTQPIRIIRDAVDSTKFSPQADGASMRNQWGIEKDQVVVGVVGRISYWKGQDVFVKAAARAVKSATRLFFVIVGDPVPGDESRLKDLRMLVEQLGLADKVAFVPYTGEMPKVMCALDILVLPSLLPEPLGLVVLEAMACGRPVIISAHGGPLEIVRDGDTGLQFPPRDADALAQAILELAGNPKRRSEMGERARQHVLDYYSLERFNRQFGQLYTDLLGSLRG